MRMNSPPPNQAIQATGRGAGALTRQAHWPAPDFSRSGVLRTPERGAELSLPTADLFGCALIRTPEQIRWSEVSTDYKSALQPAA